MESILRFCFWAILWLRRGSNSRHWFHYFSVSKEVIDSNIYNYRYNNFFVTLLVFTYVLSGHSSACHRIGIGLGYLTPLSTIFQLYWWRKPEYPGKITDLPHAIQHTFIKSIYYNVVAFLRNRNSDELLCLNVLLLFCFCYLGLVMVENITIHI